MKFVRPEVENKGFISAKVSIQWLSSSVQPVELMRGRSVAPSRHEWSLLGGVVEDLGYVGTLVVLKERSYTAMVPHHITVWRSGERQDTKLQGRRPHQFQRTKNSLVYIERVTGEKAWALQCRIISNGLTYVGPILFSVPLMCLVCF